MISPPTSYRDGLRSFHWRFSCIPSSAAESRRAVETLDGELDEPLMDDVRLLVSELVANSVRHGPAERGTPIRLRLWVSEGVVHAEVHDRGRGFAATAADYPPVENESGRGLYLMEQLADRWGIAGDPGTVVWFEINRPRLNGHDPHAAPADMLR